MQVPAFWRPQTPNKVFLEISHAPHVHARINKQSDLKVMSKSDCMAITPMPTVLERASCDDEFETELYRIICVLNVHATEIT